jgi:hypothetical protein
MKHSSSSLHSKIQEAVGPRRLRMSCAAKRGGANSSWRCGDDGAAPTIQRVAAVEASRWIVGAAPSSPHRPLFEFGPPRFAAQLIRNRRGPTASWIFEWSDDDECFVRATPALPVAAAPLDRPHRAVA